MPRQPTEQVAWIGEWPLSLRTHSGFFLFIFLSFGTVCLCSFFHLLQMLCPRWSVLEHKRKTRNSPPHTPSRHPIESYESGSLFLVLLLVWLHRILLIDYHHLPNNPFREYLIEWVVFVAVRAVLFISEFLPLLGFREFVLFEKGKRLLRRFWVFFHIICEAVDGGGWRWCFYLLNNGGCSIFQTAVAVQSFRQRLLCLKREYYRIFCVCVECICLQDFPFIYMNMFLLICAPLC